MSANLKEQSVFDFEDLPTRKIESKSKPLEQLTEEDIDLAFERVFQDVELTEEELEVLESLARAEESQNLGEVARTFPMIDGDALRKGIDLGSVVEGRHYLIKVEGVNETLYVGEALKSIRKVQEFLSIHEQMDVPKKVFSCDYLKDNHIDSSSLSMLFKVHLSHSEGTLYVDDPYRVMVFEGSNTVIKPLDHEFVAKVINSPVVDRRGALCSTLNWKSEVPKTTR